MPIVLALITAIAARVRPSGFDHRAIAISNTRARPEAGVGTRGVYEGRDMCAPRAFCFYTENPDSPRKMAVPDGGQ